MIEVPNYFRKQDKPLFSDLFWNLPEQKQGSMAILGGNSQSFAVVNRAVNNVSNDFPVREVVALLPDSLKNKLPPVPELMFFPSTESGSFAKSSEIFHALSSFDYSLIIGDLSKNSETEVAVAEAVKNAQKPMVITRDAIDLLSSDMGEILMQEGVVLIGSMMQMQKVLRAMYYPKMLLLSMPLMSAVEVLHKFTLSYPATILTFHEGQVLVANGGEVVATKIEQTNYSPISLWEGRLAADVAALNLFNPKKELQATAAAVLGM